MNEEFTFIHINKTAGTSIENALGVSPSHKTAMTHIRSIGYPAWVDKYTFTFVRNPWDRVVSHYHFRVETNKTGMGDKHISFSAWVKEAYGNKSPEYNDVKVLFMPQVDWVTDRKGRILVDDIYRFENIDEDFDKLCEVLKVKAELPHTNRTDRGHYKEYFDEETKDIIAKAFKDDVAAFGYTY